MRKKLLKSIVVANFVLIIGGVLFTVSDSPITRNSVEANTTFAGQAVLDVPEFLDLGSAILRIDKDANITGQTGADIWDFGTRVTSFDFGNLEPITNTSNTNQILYMGSEYYFAVVMYPSTSGIPYDIKQSAGQLQCTGDCAQAGATIPNNGFLSIPAYYAGDKTSPTGTAQGNKPSAATIGQAGSAVATGRQIYSSGGTAVSRIVRTYLTLGGPDAGGYIRSCQSGYAADGSCATWGTDYTPTWNGGVTPSQPSGNYRASQDITFTISKSGA